MKKYVGVSIVTFLGLLLFLGLSNIYDPTSLLGNHICGIDIKIMLLFGYYSFMVGITLIILFVLFDFACYLYKLIKKYKKEK